MNRSPRDVKDPDPATGDAALDSIAALPDEWHGSGSLSPRVLRAIHRHCRARGPILHSLETGAGKSTLLFSHLSSHHLVFSIDRGSSLAQVKGSPILDARAVEFVEGPTQKTLPAFTFPSRIQAALIDGPHAYPFPDLEYYYVYPLLEEGALLIIDDIDIPSIRRMIDILRKDEMFRLIEIVDQTAFFERTGSPAFNPLGDGWGRQGYNAAHRRRKMWLLDVARRFAWLRALPGARALARLLLRLG